MYLLLVCRLFSDCIPYGFKSSYIACHCFVYERKPSVERKVEEVIIPDEKEAEPEAKAAEPAKKKAKKK